MPAGPTSEVFFSALVHEVLSQHHSATKAEACAVKVFLPQRTYQTNTRRATTSGGRLKQTPTSAVYDNTTHKEKNSCRS